MKADAGSHIVDPSKVRRVAMALTEQDSEVLDTLIRYSRGVAGEKFTMLLTGTIDSPSGEAGTGTERE
jgi:hypothetical protein